MHDKNLLNKSFYVGGLYREWPRNCCKTNRRPAKASTNGRPLGPLEGFSGPLGPLEGFSGPLGPLKWFSGPLGPLEGFSGPLGPLEGFSGPLGPLEGFSGPLGPLERLPPGLLKGRVAGRGAGGTGRVALKLNEFLLRECYSPVLPTPANIIRPPRGKNHVYFCIRSIVKSI
jgi:hypothetical protein